MYTVQSLRLQQHRARLLCHDLWSPLPPRTSYYSFGKDSQDNFQQFWYFFYKHVICWCLPSLIRPPVPWEQEWNFKRSFSSQTTPQQKWPSESLSIQSPWLLSGSLPWVVVYGMYECSWDTEQPRSPTPWRWSCTHRGCYVASPSKRMKKAC